MARFLDRLYLAAGALAAALILGICLLVTAQVGLNLAARLGGPGWSATIPSYADFAGFMLAGATFLALPHTLRAGGHIRVSLVTRRLPPRAAVAAEVAALLAALALCGTASWFVIRLIGESMRYGDTSSGMVAVPLWVPQLSLAAGLILLCIALAQTLVETLIARQPVLRDSGDA